MRNQLAGVVHNVPLLTFHSFKQISVVIVSVNCIKLNRYGNDSTRGVLYHVLYYLHYYITRKELWLDG